MNAKFTVTIREILPPTEERKFTDSKSIYEQSVEELNIQKVIAVVNGAELHVKTKLQPPIQHAPMSLREMLGEVFASPMMEAAMQKAEKEEKKEDKYDATDMRDEYYRGAREARKTFLINLDTLVLPYTDHISVMAVRNAFMKFKDLLTDTTVHYIPKAK